MTQSALSFSQRVAALVDQGLVSVTNFLTFLLCARSLTPEDWGAFGFSYAAVVFCQGFQRAMVIIPMITFHSTRDDWERNALAWTGLNARLTLVVLGASATLTLVASVLGIGWLSWSGICATLLTVPLFSMELSRRLAIQAEHFGKLVLMALSYTTTTLALALGWPDSWEDRWMPVAAIAAGGTIATCIFCGINWKRFVGRNDQPLLEQAEYQQFRNWANLSHLGFSGYNFAVQGLLGAMAGAHALGAFHACRTLIQPVNVLVGAMDSIDKPRLARAYAETGKDGLLGALTRALMILGCTSMVYVAIVLIFDHSLLRIAYRDKYLQEVNVLTAWCVVALLSSFAQPLESSLYVTRRTKALFHTRLIASGLSLTSAFLLIGTFGASGALVAMAVGYAATLAISAAFVRRNA